MLRSAHTLMQQQLRHPRMGSSAAASSVRSMSGGAVMVKRRPRREDFNAEIQGLIDQFPGAPYTQEPRGTEYTAAVTSAHMVDATQVSTLDSVALSPEGSVIHGRYGVLPEPAASAIPLEYLALLRPAAEGAAAFRALTEASKGQKGTVLVYGASQVNGMAVSQLANAVGHAVVAVVAGNHSGNDHMMFSVKNMLNEPGTAVPQELAYVKAVFRDLVQGISKGDEGFDDVDAEAYLEDFKGLLKEYSEYYPNTRPGAVSQEMLEFDPNYMEKDREMFDVNMRTYVEENYPPGAPPVDDAKLDAFFSAQQYEIFRQKFWHQTTMQLAGVEVEEFNPPDVVQEQIKTPEEPAKAMANATGFPYTFSIFNKEHPEGTTNPAGGPVLGAVISVNPALLTAANAVAAATTTRGKAEALQFVTNAERLAYLGACSVAQQAKEAGAPVYVVGGELPGLETVEVTDADVQQTLAAMDVDDNGNTILNFFVQSYRANDFPFYADYATFRASEPLAGPREFVVLK